MNSTAAIKCGAAVLGVAVLGVAGYELVRYANAQAIIAGSPLPALTVALLVSAAWWAVAQLAPEL